MLFTATTTFYAHLIVLMDYAIGWWSWIYVILPLCLAFPYMLRSLCSYDFSGYIDFCIVWHDAIFWWLWWHWVQLNVLFSNLFLIAALFAQCISLWLMFCSLDSFFAYFILWSCSDPGLNVDEHNWVILVDPFFVLKRGWNVSGSDPVSVSPLFNFYCCHPSSYEIHCV